MKMQETHLTNALLERSMWCRLALMPVTSGMYEVIIAEAKSKKSVSIRQIELMSWNGQLWTRVNGAAISKKDVQHGHWRGLTRAAFERESSRMGLSVFKTKFPAKEEHVEFERLPSINDGLPEELKAS